MVKVNSVPASFRTMPRTSRFGRFSRRAAFVSSLALGSAALSGCGASRVPVRTVEQAKPEEPVIQTPLSDKKTEPDKAKPVSDTTMPEIIYGVGTGMPFPGTEVSFYENGKIGRGTLADDTVIGGIKYKAGTKVLFYKNGKVETGTLAADTTIQGIKYKAGTFVRFNYRNGKVSQGTLAADTTIYGLKYKAGGDVMFHLDGKVEWGTLAADTSIQGIKYKAGKEEPWPPTRPSKEPFIKPEPM
jgi:hypothetical protein